MLKYDKLMVINMKWVLFGGVIMKATGIERKVDELGRVVLPIELRRHFKIEIKDPLEISVNEDEILLSKYVPRCVFCKSEEDIMEIKGKNICKKCLDELKLI